MSEPSLYVASVNYSPPVPRELSLSCRCDNEMCAEGPPQREEGQSLAHCGHNKLERSLGGCTWR
eukprot:1171767-Amphidinium_carterae.1